MNDVIVVGGGPAGMTAAYAAASNGNETVLLDGNEKLGKKLFLTGKGRCNLTNDRNIEEFFPQIVRNPKFLMSALHSFDNRDLINLLEQNGLRTKTERGGRVFPASDHSSDVIKTLRRMTENAGVRVQLDTKVVSAEKENGVFIVTAADGTKYRSKSLILACGGLSYPSTGSTGDGYRFAQAFGHSIAEPAPALVSLKARGNDCAPLQGLSLKNIGFTIYEGKRAVYSEQGEMLFTHFGISGPVVLSASCFIHAKKLPDNIYAEIDLKPALTNDKLNARLLREFEANPNKQLKSVMSALQPKRMISVFLERCELDPQKPVHSITKTERAQIVFHLKHFTIDIAEPLSVEEAIITAGGVNVKEIHPQTMESKCAEGLYFAGEMIDVHALTGGFNLQIAFSTGYAAGKNA